MESESADDSGAAVRGAPIIFISDASAEAERLTAALRARGYVVADVPLALLAGRVAVQRPALVLCDADADGSSDALRRVRQVDEEGPIPVVLLGERDGAMAGLGAELVEGAFARPVNVQELVGTVERLIGGGQTSPSRPPSARNGSKIATSSRPPGRASVSPASRGPTDRNRPDTALQGATSLPLPPDLAEDAVAPARDGADAPSVELSREIQQVLLDAERRLEETHPFPASGHEELGPEIEVEGTLPPEMLVALDEPLDDEDLGGDGTPVPSNDGTGSLTSSKAAVRGHTQIGGGGTFATSLIDGTAATPPSEGTRAPGTAIDGTRSQRAVPPTPESDDGRLARQLASTPKPPKPTPDEVSTGTALETPPRGTVPPPTIAETGLSDVPPASASSADGPASFRGSFSAQTTNAERSSPERPRVTLNFDSDPPERRDLSSTTPPLRNHDDQSVPPIGRESDRPMAPATSPPGAIGRDSDRPSGPRTEPPSERPAERPQARATPKSPPLNIPSVLRAGDTISVLATAIRARYSGALAFEVDEGIRRVVFREGDFVTLTSGAHGESLVAFLAAKGDLPAEVARQGHKLPASGRRAGAALVANGHLAQDQLWPVLRAHAEWLIGKILGIERGNVSIEEIGRLQDEPAVFGGATGAEVLVEVVRRIVPPEEALERLGGPNGGLTAGPGRALLSECALSPIENDRAQHVDGLSLHELLDASADASFASALYALVALSVLRVDAPRVAAAHAPAAPAAAVRDEIDDDALREKILARKALVDDGDYFAVLGVARSATGYDIRRAYTALRRELEPSRALTSGTADLADTVDEIVMVLEEAYQILSDQRRRERYRRAIETGP